MNNNKLKWWQYALIFAVVGGVQGAVKSYFEIKERKRQEAIESSNDVFVQQMKKEVEDEAARKIREKFYGNRN